MPELAEMQKDRIELSNQIQRLMNEFMKKYKVKITDIDFIDASDHSGYCCVVMIMVEL